MGNFFSQAAEIQPRSRQTRQPTLSYAQLEIFYEGFSVVPKRPLVPLLIAKTFFIIVLNICCCHLLITETLTSCFS